MTDSKGREITKGKVLISERNDIYQVVEDEHLGLVIFNVKTQTIEKLLPDVAKELQLTDVVWVDTESIIL